MIYAMGQLQETLDEHVRPALRSHAGDVLIALETDDVLELQLQGTCSRCLFRSTCVVNLIVPAVQAALPRPKQVRVRGMRVGRIGIGLPA